MFLCLFCLDELFLSVACLNAAIDVVAHKQFYQADERIDEIGDGAVLPLAALQGDVEDGVGVDRHAESELVEQVEGVVDDFVAPLLDGTGLKIG